MNAYDALAHTYDILTRDVPYEQTADFYEALFAREDVRVNTILDLACGTGTLTCILAGRGYEMIGTDASAEMLVEAYDKSASMENRPLFLNQTMEGLDLYGTVDAAVCALDGINHVTPENLCDVLHRIWLFLQPGGVFIFDILTPEALRHLDGEMFMDETDDVFCVWRTEFDDEQNACLYVMDIFTRDGACWARSREAYTEYAYEPEDLVKRLTNEGFNDVILYGDKTLEPPDGSARRVYMTARKPLSKQ